MFGAQNAFEVTPARGLKTSALLLEFSIFWWCFDFRSYRQHLAVEQVQYAKLCLTDMCSVLQHGSKHWLQLAGRRTNDAQHIGSGRLLLQGLPQFIEQTRILDGDDGLGGEVLYQGNLFFREGPNLLTVDDDDANQYIVLEHRHVNDGSRAAELSRHSGGSYSGVVGGLGYLLC